MTLSARDITVNFSGIKALNGIALDVVPGVVHALIGPNGAGKTTMLNVLSGFILPTSGSIRLGEKEMAGEPAHTRAACKIARSFQTPRFVPHASIRDNVLVGFFSQARVGLVRTLFGTRGYVREERDLKDRAQALLERLELDDIADELARDVPLWRLREMEIARCLAAEPEFVFLDEPAAGSDEHERGLLAQHISTLADSGVGVLLVEHNFGFIKQVARDVTVLSRGDFLAHGTPGEIEVHPDVVEIYLGGEE